MISTPRLPAAKVGYCCSGGATAIALIQILHTGTGSVMDEEVEAAVRKLQAAASDFSTAVSNLGAAQPQP
jgi:hypothetical protein